MKKYILTPILFLFVLKGYCYSPDNHAIITQMAVDYLNEHVRTDYIAEDEAKNMIEGNKSEDESKLKLPFRLFNFHFYHPSKWKRIMGLTVGSIDRRFNRITKRCLRKTSSSKYFFHIGEILHHLQDYTNPAHVVPVFHLKDAFDKQLIASTSSCDTFKIAYDAKPKKKYDKFFLDPIANQTLQSMKDSFDVVKSRKGNTEVISVDWTSFWQPSKVFWFGRYGKINRKRGLFKSDHYGENNIVIGKTTYTIDPQLYKEYSEQQICLAVMETARFIYFAKERMQK
ncbi:MAG: hypothetical protein COA58_03720 [Bacteroidetes bacterium]|nr:MAG: hypothetical protein COA58_03720 [Bacteroidota bacterium]